MASCRRPEHKAPPEIYYNEGEAEKYTKNSRIIDVQEKCSERAIELLALPDDKSLFLLDLGCGSGLSGEVMSSHGHQWIGLDISVAMLNVALEREVGGDLILSDLGQGLSFRAGIFDGAISISAIQWLCNADKTGHNPARRLYNFFATLYACLFYPENDAQVELIVSQAMKSGFTGGLVVDFPNSTKAKKMFLVLMCGGSFLLPSSLDDTCTVQSQALFQKRERAKALKMALTKKECIKIRKDRRRRQGRETCNDSKYSGRKRSKKFF